MPSVAELRCGRSLATLILTDITDIVESFGDGYFVPACFKAAIRCLDTASLDRLLPYLSRARQADGKTDLHFAPKSYSSATELVLLLQDSVQRRTYISIEELLNVVERHLPELPYATWKHVAIVAAVEELYTDWSEAFGAYCTEMDQFLEQMQQCNELRQTANFIDAAATASAISAEITLHAGMESWATISHRINEELDIEFELAGWDYSYNRFSTFSAPFADPNDDQQALTSDWPPDDTWHFRKTTVAFRGKQKRFPKQMALILQRLVNARRPLTINDLRSCWDEPEKVSSDNVMTHINQLKKRLMKWLPRDTDPILREWTQSRERTYELAPDLRA